MTSASQHSYYISTGNKKEGPLDLVTVMRRIKSGKIAADTLIFVGESPTPTPATSIEALSIFFIHHRNTDADHTGKNLFSLKSIIAEGWRFTSEHNIMTVFSGGITLIGILLTSITSDALGNVVGGMIGWVIFLTMQHIYLVFALRLYRGQPISSEFLNRQLAPALGTIILASATIALMMVGGITLLVIPALIVSVYYIYVPLFIIDRRLDLIQAMYASRLLVYKHQQRYQKTIALLVLSYTLSLIAIIPIPLTMAIFSGALIKSYEELLAA